MQYLKFVWNTPTRDFKYDLFNSQTDQFDTLYKQTDRLYLKDYPIIDKLRS